MPDYLKRVGRDTTDDTIIRTSEAEKTLARVRGPASKRLGIDRGSIPSVAAPLEGQMMLQYAAEAVGATPVSPEVGATFKAEGPYYFSNGEWRPFGAPPDPDFGMYETSGVTVATSSQDVDSWLHHSESVMLDLTDPQNPAFTERGVYSVTGAVSFDGGWPAPGSRLVFPLGYFEFHGGSAWTTISWFQSQPSGGHYSNFPPPISFYATFQADVGSYLTLTYDNTDTASHFFSASQIRVQRIFSY